MIRKNTLLVLSKLINSVKLEKFMSNILNLKGVKLFAIVVLAVALLATLGIVAVQKADAASCSITTTLRVGSTGAEVMCLQAAVGVTADGKFGPMTKAAVMAWQTSVGLTADGVFGPMSLAKWLGTMTGGSGALCPNGNTVASSCTVPPSGSSGPTCPNGNLVSNNCGAAAGPGPGTLSGGAGSITIDGKSSYSNEDVTEGTEDVKVLAFEIEADDESDVDITSIKVELFQGTAADSSDLPDYAKSVSVWMGSTKVGEADADNFSENSDVWSKSISLNNAIVDAGDTETFVVAITANNNLDSGDIDTDAWYIGVSNVRFEDGEGVVTTESVTLDVDEEVVDDEVEQTFDFDSLATSGDLELKLTEASDNPDAMVVEVSETGDTNVTVLKFKLKAEGSDMLIDAIELTGTASGVDATFADMVSEISLLAGSNELDSVSAYADAVDDTTGNLAFTDLDFTIEEGDTETFSVVVKVKDILSTSGSSTAFDQGDSYTVSFDGSTNLDDTTNTDVDDDNGDTVVAGDRTGSVTGDAQSFYTKGILVTPGSMTAVSVPVDGAADYSEIKIKFSVTALGQDVYLDKTTTSSTSTSSTAAGDNRAQISNSSGTALTLTAASVTSTDSDAEEKTNTFKIPEGSTAEFTMTLNATGTNAQVRGILYGLEWGTSDAATGSSVFTSDTGVDGSYKTGYVYVSSS